MTYNNIISGSILFLTYFIKKYKSTDVSHTCIANRTVNKNIYLFFCENEYQENVFFFFLTQIVK